MGRMFPIYMCFNLGWNERVFKYVVSHLGLDFGLRWVLRPFENQPWVWFSTWVDFTSLWFYVPYKPGFSFQPRLILYTTYVGFYVPSREKVRTWIQPRLDFMPLRKPTLDLVFQPRLTFKPFRITYFGLTVYNVVSNLQYILPPYIHKKKRGFDVITYDLVPTGFYVPSKNNPGLDFNTG